MANAPTVSIVRGNRAARTRTAREFSWDTSEGANVDLDLRVVVDAVEFERELDSFKVTEVDRVNDALRERGDHPCVRPWPEPVITSTAFEAWMLKVEATVKRLEENEKRREETVLPDLSPPPVPARFGTLSLLWEHLDHYNRQCEAWLRVWDHVLKRLHAPRAPVPGRPLLPAFVPNSVPSFHGDPTAPPLSSDAHSFLLESTAPIEGSTDPSAPAIYRGYFNHSYTFLGKGEAAGGWEHDILFLSNVDYVPYPPANELPTERADCRYGPHERTRRSQWHEVGCYHMAFVPTCMDGRVERLEHQNLDGDMAWYNVDFAAHCSPAANHRFFASLPLRTALARDWATAHEDYVRWGQIRGTEPGMPQGAFMRGRQALGYIEHPLSKRELLSAVAGYQRALQEVRGWNNYQRCRSEQRDIQRSYERRGAPFAPSVDLARQSWQRKPYRGVFTWDENVAKRIAQFGVPVFFMVAFKRDQILNPIWKRVEFVHPQCELALWDDLREPTFLAGVQETRELPLADPCGVDAADDTEERGDDDSQEMQLGGDDAMPHLEEAALGLPAQPVVQQDAMPRAPPRAGYRSAGTETDSTGATAIVKRKADGPPEEIQSSKRATGPATAPGIRKARHPKKDDFEWPAYFPLAWEVAREAVQAVDSSDEHYTQLYGSRNEPFPMSDTLLHGRELLVPTLGIFARMNNAGYLSRMFASYVALRSEFIKEAATQSPDKVHRFSAAQWRQILKGFVPRAAHVEYGKVLGLYATAARAENENPKTSTAQSAANSLPPERIGSRAEDEEEPADRGRELRFMDPDEVPTEEEAAEDFSARVFLAAAPQDERELAQEPERYLFEPSGWRLQGPGQQRALDDFQWFVEEESEVDYTVKDEAQRENQRIFEMKRAGKKLRRLDTHDYFWNYERGWVLGFDMQHEGPRTLVLGEQRTKRLRFFEDAGGQGRRKYLFKTEHFPMQLRVWQCRPMGERLSLGLDPLGRVGCRTQCPEKYLLSADDYKLIYTGAQAAAIVVAKQRRQMEDRRDKERLEEERAAAERDAQREEPEAAKMQSAAASTSETVSTASVAFPEATVFKGNKPGKKRQKERKGKERVEDASEPMELDPAMPIASGTHEPWNLVTALTPAAFRFDQHSLATYAPPAHNDPAFAGYVWPSAAWRTYIVWDVAELLFRFEVYALDYFLRTQYPMAPALARETTLERQQLVFDIWQGRNFLPSGPSPLTAAEWRVREPAVRAFGRIVGTWPRTALAAAPETFTREDFIAYETSVWTAYGQTYMDYHWREAPFPCRFPDVLPF